MSLYDAIANTEGGRLQLAKARLRYRILSVLNEALTSSGMLQNDVASRVGVGKSAVSQVFAGNGNLRVDTVATYLDAMGYELHINLASAGAARAEATDWVTGPVLQGELPTTAQARPAIFDFDNTETTFEVALPSPAYALAGAVR